MNLEESFFRNFVDHQEVIHDHFLAAHWLEIIPFRLRDSRDGFEYRNYLHSFNRKIKPIENELV